MSLSTTSSRRHHQSQKPIIHSREPSTDSRSSYTNSERTYYSSSRSSMSSMGYHNSSRSEVYHEPDRVYKFRAPDSDNYQGTYKYSPSNKIKVINHNAQRVDDPHLHSSRATHEDYKRTQQRFDKPRTS